MAWPRAASLGKKGPGSTPTSFSPPRSLSWLARMVAAMAQVNPTVTAWGMWRIREPMRSTPARVSITPDSSTASTRPSTPKRTAVAETSTMKAPAGPPIW